MSNLSGPRSLEEFRVNPYPLLSFLREHKPVYWLADERMWLVTRRVDILTILRDPQTFSTDSPRSPIRNTLGAQMLSVEGDDHRRYRRQCMPPFRTREVHEQGSTIVREAVSALLKRLDGRDSVDLRQEFAGPLALRVVSAILGLPHADGMDYRAWYDDFAESLASFGDDPGPRDRATATAGRFREHVGAYLRTLVHDSPGAGSQPSLLAVLAGTTDDRLSDEEILSNAMIILFGGIETTESMIANTIWALLTNPAQRELAMREDALLEAAIEETLRWEPPVQSCTRYATRGAELHGVSIDAGSVVQCMLGGANRDPMHFDDPDRFDIRRSNASEHLSFGAGRHVCIGAGLARLEARLGIGALLTRFPGLALDPERPSAPEGYEFRKPPTLYATLRG